MTAIGRFAIGQEVKIFGQKIDRLIVGVYEWVGGLSLPLPSQGVSSFVFIQLINYRMT